MNMAEAKMRCTIQIQTHFGLKISKERGWYSVLVALFHWSQIAIKARMRNQAILDLQQEEEKQRTKALFWSKFQSKKESKRECEVEGELSRRKNEGKERKRKEEKEGGEAAEQRDIAAGKFFPSSLCFSFLIQHWMGRAKVGMWAEVRWQTVGQLGTA